MTHTIPAAELKIGDRYLSTANQGRAVTVNEASPFDAGRVILTVTDDDGMTYRTILKAERELEAAEAIPAASVVHFSVSLNTWVSTDGREVCQDHATPTPCPFC